MLKSIKMILAIAAHYNYEIWKMYVKMPFMNGYLEEDIFMEKPRDFESSNSNQVCKFKRSIYGLKQASRSWNIRFDNEIKEFGLLEIRMNLVYKRKSVGVREPS